LKSQNHHPQFNYIGLLSRYTFHC